MEFYTIAELKAKGSQIVQIARRKKETALITRHGKPMVLIVPVSEQDIEWTGSPAVKKRLTRALKERAEGRIVSPRRLGTHA